ncbi:hypothetical protein [Pararhizobium haloflavum]|uniref:hypothetical protein n=1 Tax=Pararhizobium haloflavum TaxID=2037914 RepID=UPI000C18CC1F|nr:hypothetical protein [Pararhizobium haloflavum]
MTLYDGMRIAATVILVLFAWSDHRRGMRDADDRLYGKAAYHMAHGALMMAFAIFVSAPL